MTEAETATSLLDKLDGRAKNITSVKEGYFIMIQGSVHQEARAVLKVYTPNKSHKYDRTIKGNGQIYNYCWRFQFPFLNNWFLKTK